MPNISWILARNKTQSGTLERNEGIITNGAHKLFAFKVPKGEELGKDYQEKGFIYNLTLGPKACSS